MRLILIAATLMGIGAGLAVLVCVALVTTAFSIFY